MLEMFELDFMRQAFIAAVLVGAAALVRSRQTSTVGALGLAATGIATAYLDGATTRRDEVIQEFRRGDAPVFLISLKAGGSGLNLTAADSREVAR